MSDAGVDVYQTQPSLQALTYFGCRHFSIACITQVTILKHSREYFGHDIFQFVDPSMLRP